MNADYKIVGADGRQYGPVSADQIRRWIAEGRVESRTPVFTNGAKDWTFIGLLPEFASCFPSAPPPAIAPPIQPRENNSFATAGMVCGILAWVFFCCCGGIPFNVLGLVFSLIGWSRASRHPGLYGGRGIAIAGLALSIASLVLGIILMLCNFALHPSSFSWQFRTL